MKKELVLYIAQNGRHEVHAPSLLYTIMTNHIHKEKSLFQQI